MQSNATSTSSQSGSSDDFSMTDGGSGSESGNDGGLEGSASEGSMDDSEGGSYSGSSSSSLEYECDCRSVRRVSLMGASDYCLAPNASLSSKCGNVDLREDGGCPIVGAQPCSSKGHVLTNDSFCALDKKDDTYKCVASKNDLEIQKNGKKKKKNANRRNGSETATSAATVELGLTARQVLAIVVCVAAGMMALV
uniref:Uncharacterized protein n=1 Tax=Hyaloperonospora arabidopsidis (strain Emoy2) TaxID=559515 RepID=M4BTT4_HYAAE